MPTSFGSLKTEEKTERQCGQHVHLGPDCLSMSLSTLSVQFIQSTGFAPRSITSKSIGPSLSDSDEHSLLCVPTHIQIGRARALADRFLLESLILAQDERWRRA